MLAVLKVAATPIAWRHTYPQPELVQAAVFAQRKRLVKGVRDFREAKRFRGSAQPSGFPQLPTTTSTTTTTTTTCYYYYYCCYYYYYE